MSEHLLPEGEPTLSSSSILAKAWKFDLSKARANPQLAKDDDATVCTWIVYVPWAHGFWHSYMLACIHLRPIEGVKAPTIHLPGATHEILLFALDPKFRPSPSENLHFLTPPNFIGQFMAESDEKAAERIEGDVRDILAGTLSPDTDFRRMWVARYGDHSFNLASREPKGSA